jgi:hypothetical protein
MRGGCVSFCVCVYKLYKVRIQGVLIVRFKFLLCWNVELCTATCAFRKTFSCISQFTRFCKSTALWIWEFSTIIVTMVTVPLFIKLTCAVSKVWILVFNLLTSNSRSLILSSVCRHRTNFRMHVPFTVQYYNLQNYPSEPFRRVYYIPAAQNPMSAVLFSSLHVWCVAWRQAVLVWQVPMYVHVGIFTYAVTWVVRRNW